MEKTSNSEIKVGSVVYLKSDTNFSLPMIVKSMPGGVLGDEVFLSWISSQKTVVRGSFPLDALIAKDDSKK